jgi:hypothetical protein
VEIVREHVERGGRLFVALRPRQKTGLEAFLRESGVRVGGEGQVVDPSDCLFPYPTIPKVRQFALHEVNAGMGNSYVVMPESCPVDPEDPQRPDWRVNSLVRSGPQSWEEKGPLDPQARPRRDGDERGGNLPLVVAVEKPASRAPEGSGKKAKLIVWGSAAALTNAFLSPGGAMDSRQVDYVINNFRWLADRGALEIGPTPVKEGFVDIQMPAMVRLRWVVLAGFPLLGVLLGLMTWFLRRK